RHHSPTHARHPGPGSKEGTEPPPPRAAWPKRVQYAEGDLIGARRTRVVPGHRPEVLQADGVTTRPEPQQRVVVVVQLAGERPRCRIVLGEPLHVRLVHPGVRPQAPVRGEVVACLGPRAPAADVPMALCELRDVGELLAERLAVIEVAMQGELAGRDVAA